MTSIRTLANQLNKDDAYVIDICDLLKIVIEYDSDGEYITDADAKRLIEHETKSPNRYNKRNGVECLDITDTLSGDNNVQYFYLGCIMKYLYRRLNVTDLKKARTYLDKWIEDAENKGVIK